MNNEYIVELWDIWGSYLMLSLGLVLIAILISFLCLKHRQKVMQEYNRFVVEYYTSQGKSTPSFILRIQNDYIRRYNHCRSIFLCRILLFKPAQEVKDCSQWHMTDLNSTLPADPMVAHGNTILSPSYAIRGNRKKYWKID